MMGRSPESGSTLPLLPPATWITPLAGFLLLPLFAKGVVGTRLSFLFIELLFGLPLLLGTPGFLRHLYLPAPVLGKTRALSFYGLALLAVPLFQLSSYAIGTLMKVPEELAQSTSALLLPQSFADAMLIGVTLVAVTPVCEEIFFRGFLTRVWQERLGNKGIIPGTALLFALAHMNPWQLPQLLLLGMLLSWLRVKSGSLLPPVLLHLGVNLSSWIIVLSTQGNP